MENDSHYTLSPPSYGFCYANILRLGPLVGQYPVDKFPRVYRYRAKTRDYVPLDDEDDVYTKAQLTSEEDK